MTITRLLRVLPGLFGLIALPTVTLAAEAPTPAVAAPQVMEAFPADLQKAFAADAGKVRLLLLLAPS